MLPLSTSSLSRWQPTDSEPWNLRRVWHLHRRAGFGATWSELQRDLSEDRMRQLIASLPD
ncbi:hypothetical protein [Fuerstiella marisgermanici]|uniref:hypothetical protein n=1 Tax=Fuerstiella marisgermanici TaxID=1891926 RepID=UPI001C54FD73|nr:hypothetical protein [Fuerstiella marisgermanici]